MVYVTHKDWPTLVVKFMVDHPIIKTATILESNIMNMYLLDGRLIVHEFMFLWKYQDSVPPKRLKRAIVQLPLDSKTFNTFKSSLKTKTSV